MLRHVVVFLLLWSVAAPPTSGLGPAQEKPKEPAAVILFPKEGAKVSRVDQIEGKVNSKKGWPIVLVQPLVGDEPWWIQPAVNAVEGGYFSAAAYFGNLDTELGTRFRIVILLAKNRGHANKFKAGTTLRELPDLPKSEPVTLVREIARSGEESAKTRLITFSGKSWEVKKGHKLGPGPNDWSDTDESVWLDDKSHLHLAITQSDGRWRCAEVVATKSMGYGEYRWVISGDLPALDPRVVLGLFLYENNYREIDFELARWGSPDNANAQFVVQPYTKDSMHRFDTAKENVLTISLHWEKRLVRGRCWAGEDTTRRPLADWKYTGRKIPPPGKERARANLWLFFGKAPTGMARQEVVIRSFLFKPTASSEARPNSR